MLTRVLAWAAIVAFATAGWTPLTNAHSWYPLECCREIDCAPVDSVVRVVPAAGGPPQLLVTSEHGTAIVPHDFLARESKDGRMHICMGYDAFGNRDVLCFFIPPSM
jgi:hypothetical protein